MSGISPTWGYYPSGSVAGCMPIPELGWSHTLPPSVLIDQRLEAHQNEFVTLRWLTDGFGAADPRAARHLFRLRRYGEIAIIDNGRIVCAPASLAGEWEQTKAQVLSQIRGAAPTSFTAVAAAAKLSETTVKTALQILSDDGLIEGAIPATGATDWAAMQFRRTAGPQPRP